MDAEGRQCQNYWVVSRIGPALRAWASDDVTSTTFAKVWEGLAMNAQTLYDCNLQTSFVVSSQTASCYTTGQQLKGLLPCESLPAAVATVNKQVCVLVLISRRWLEAQIELR